VIETSGFDPVLITVVPLGLLIGTWYAAAIPAQRTTRIDPMMALRQDWVEQVCPTAGLP